MKLLFPFQGHGGACNFLNDQLDPQTGLFGGGRGFGLDLADDRLFTAHNQPGAGGEFLPWVGNLGKASADHYGVFGAQLTDRIKNAADGDIADGQAVFLQRRANAG